MSETKFTPGPWTTLPCSNGGMLVVRESVPGHHLQSHIQIVPKADAYLIAASPDLLEACKRILKDIEADDITIGAIEDLQAAVKKAEGI